MRTILCAMSLLVAACGGGAAATSGSTTATSSTGNLRFADALARAEAQYPDALPIEVEIEAHDGRDAVEVEVLNGAEILEIYYDPSSGEVVHNEVETDAAENAAVPTLRAQLEARTTTLRAALDLATSRYREDTVREVELAMHEGRLVVHVLVRDGDATTNYRHDPATGELLGQEAATGEEEEASATQE